MLIQIWLQRRPKSITTEQLSTVHSLAALNFWTEWTIKASNKINKFNQPQIGPWMFTLSYLTNYRMQSRNHLADCVLAVFNRPIWLSNWFMRKKRIGEDYKMQSVASKEFLLVINSMCSRMSHIHNSIEFPLFLTVFFSFFCFFFDKIIPFFATHWIPIKSSMQLFAANDQKWERNTCTRHTFWLFVDLCNFFLLLVAGHHH